MFLSCERVYEALACRADINVLSGYVSEVLLAETSLSLCVRGHRFWQRDGNAGFVTLQNLLAAEVAAVGDDVEIVCFQSCLC